MSVLRNARYDWVFPGLVFLLALGFLVKSHTLSSDTGEVPTLIGWMTLLVTSIDLFSRLQIPAGEALGRILNSNVRKRPAEEGRDRTSNGRVVVAVTGIVALVAGLVLVGVLYTVPTFLFIALFWGGGRRLAASLLLAVAVTGLLWGIFTGLLRLELYPGLLLAGSG
jgi:hypothetical protein